ncbi:hypothetical protein HDV04_005844 [Boothiomyces sp. JEL0838]|nr:hypothetical protein HDV04_005844 [Boothiomyces sp. JEL0838]
MNELFQFLKHDRLDVRNEAVKIVAGLTAEQSNFDYFRGNGNEPVQDLMSLITDEPLTAHDALASLVNLSKDVSFVGTMANNAFLTNLLPKNVNADLCCMLLNNLSKYPIIADILLPLDSNGTHRIDNLLEIFVRGEASVYNPNANFDFLAGVFANLTVTPQGCNFFLTTSTVDQTQRLSKLVVFTEHKSVIRRGGVLSAIKNVCYGANLEKKGLDVLLSPELNLLVYILLPLSGSEDYTDEEMDGMPDELQLLDKEREQDPKLRVILLEILISLCSTREGRDYLRKIRVYEVIKKLHLAEKNADIQELIEEIVNLLMREEKALEQ